VIKDGESLKQVPEDKVHVIDLKANPPKAIGTVTVGKQPSGLSINPAGTLALVANRGGNSISVLSIKGTEVNLIDTIAMGDSVAHATFTPDGKRALALKFPAHKVSLLDVAGDTVTYNNKLDLPTGLWPFNVAVAPSGKIALTADRVVVGEGPEGLAISPKGDVAVAVMLAGSNNKPAYFYHRNGSLAVLRIDGKKVTKINDIEVGGLPEAVAFTPDGRFLLVGNYLDQDFSILRVNGTTITDTGKRFKVPGHPASARMSPR
jgi:DNA-binding beta-propeller fold protein YncE